MKFRLMIALAFIGAISMIAPPAESQGGANTESHDKVAEQTTIPHPKHQGTINLESLGRGSWIKKLAFSPDDRYLAILDNPTLGSGCLIIRDLQHNREQTRISGLLASIGNDRRAKILWGPDGKYIFFGWGPQAQFWDPLTGRVLKEGDALSFALNFNRDGSKLLAYFHKSAFLKFRIYDTTTWNYKEYEDDGLMIQTLCWTADDNVLVAGNWPKKSVGRSLDDLTPKMEDSIVRLIDPSGIKPSISVLLAPSVSSGIDNPPLVPTFDPHLSIVDYVGNKVAINIDSMGIQIGSVVFGTDHIKVLDGRTLNTLYAYAPTVADLKNSKMPGGDEGMAFSPDGQYLFLLGNHGKEKSLILDATTGAEVATFPGGRNGFAISHDGRQMAIGDGQSVELFSIQ